MADPVSTYPESRGSSTNSSVSATTSSSRDSSSFDSDFSSMVRILVHSSELGSRNSTVLRKSFPLKPPTAQSRSLTVATETLALQNVIVGPKIHLFSSENIYHERQKSSRLALIPGRKRGFCTPFTPHFMVRRACKR